MILNQAIYIHTIIDVNKTKNSQNVKLCVVEIAKPLMRIGSYIVKKQKKRNDAHNYKL